MCREMATLAALPLTDNLIAKVYDGLGGAVGVDVVTIHGTEINSFPTRDMKRAQYLLRFLKRHWRAITNAKPDDVAAVTQRLYAAHNLVIEAFDLAGVE